MGKVATAEEMALGTIPLTLGDPDMDDPNMDLVGDIDDDLDPAIVGLQEQLDGLETSHKEERTFLQNTILELSQRPPSVAAPAAAALKPVPTELDFSDLPDPVEDKEGFYKKLGSSVSDYINQHTVATTNAVTNQQATQNGLADLNNRFSRDYKELSQKPAIFHAVVAQEVKKIQNRGVNAQQVMFADPDKFLKTVATTMRNELGIEEGEEDDGNDDDNVANLKPGKKKPRTVGVKGASMPTLKRTGKAPGKKPLSLVKEIKNVQHKMGLI